MKVVQTDSTEKFSEDHDYRAFLEIEIDGESAFSFSDGEPEDASLCRDFSGCYSITDAIKKAHAAGKAGEELEVVYKESDDWI